MRADSPVQRRRPGQRRADRRLADAALPGHDDDPRCCEELRRIQAVSLRRPVGRTLPTRSPAPVAPIHDRAALAGRGGCRLLTARALGLSLVGTSVRRPPPSTTSATVATPTGEGTRPATWPCSRSAACSIRSWSTPSPGRRTTPRPAKAKALVLQANSGGVVVSDSTFAAMLRQLSAIDGARRHLDRPERLAPDRPGGPAAGRRPRGGHGARHQRRQLRARRCLEWCSTRAASPRCCATGRSARPRPTKLGVTTAGGPHPRRLHRAAARRRAPRTVTLGNERRLEPITQVQFSQLSLVDQLFHTVASPAVAYLLFAVGMALLIFDLFTAGVGVAGVVGAGRRSSWPATAWPCCPRAGWAIALLVAGHDRLRRRRADRVSRASGPRRAACCS